VVDLTGNDSGVLAIGARFSAAAGVGVGQGADGALAGVLGRPARTCNPVRQVPVYATAVAGSATITQPATLGPPTGHYWSVRRLSGTGFSAGTVTVYINSSAGEPVAQFASGGAPQLYNRGGILLHPQDYLVIVGGTITGDELVLGAADQFPDWYLSEYLA
jgi:hypothetical protein